MDEDQWYALAKSQQSADWQAGFEAAKAEYVPVLMEHLRILADLRAKIAALPGIRLKPQPEIRLTYDLLISQDDVLALLDGSSDD